MLPLLSSPWALAALAAVPALTALYWMRHSYRRVPVSSLALWLEQSESRATGLRLRRLQTPLLFFLELAALVLLALAASGPRWEVRGAAPPLVVVLDDSLSMQAGGEDSPRSRALEALQRDLDWRSTSTVRFVLAGAVPQSLGSAVTTIAESRAVLAEWRCFAAEAKLAEAVAFAIELGGPSARILVVSDRAPPDTTPRPRVVWWAFGEPRGNVAIVRAGRAPRDGYDQCYFEIANHSPGPRTAALRIQTGGTEASRQSLDLAPRELRRVSFRAKDEATPVEVQLLEDDAFPLDNVAYLVHDAPPLIRVDMKIGDGTLRTSIDKALQATGRTLPPGKQPHLFFTDSPEVPKHLSAETWVVHLFQEADADAYLGPFVLDRTHPLTDGLGLDGVVWGAGKTHDFPGVPLLLAGNVPLVTDAMSPAGQHRLRVRMRFDLSTVPQSPAWPAFLWNVVQWRARALPGLERANLALGNSVRLGVVPGTEGLTLKRPDGTSTPVRVHGGRAVLPAERPGLYELSDGTTYAVSVVNGDESNLSAATTGRWGEWQENVEGGSGIVHLAWILALAVVGILAVHMFLATQSPPTAVGG